MSIPIILVILSVMYSAHIPLAECLTTRHAAVPMRFQAARGNHQSGSTPAVWGDSVPDYSAVYLDSGQRIYLYALLFVDLKISDYYRREYPKIKDAYQRHVMKLVSEANKYLYQLGVHFIVVDVLESWRSDLSLYSFEEYRNSRIHELPYHNFAALFSYRYAGGLAFVNGICSVKSVMLAGFYPPNPTAMASIFFHEIAHLIGVPHTPFNQTLAVPNCVCEQNLPDPKEFVPMYRPSVGPGVESNPIGPANASITTEDESQTRHHYHATSSGCLRIPGFDHNCTSQLMTNLMHRNRCLHREPYMRQSTASVRAPISGKNLTLASIPLCGNLYLEQGEECDCGLEKSCWLVNCDPTTCSRLVPMWILWAVFIFLLPLIVIGASAGYHRYIQRKQRTKCPYARRDNRFDVFGQVVRLLDERFPNVRYFSLSSGWNRLLASANALVERAFRVHESHEDEASAAEGPNPNSIVDTCNRGFSKLAPPATLRGAKLDVSAILVVHPQGLRLNYHQVATGKPVRPMRPPPPPPALTQAASASNSLVTGRPRVPPPPPPSTIPTASARVETNQCETSRLINGASYLRHVDADQCSISHKFDGFDDEEDEFDSDFDEDRTSPVAGVGQDAY